MGQPGTYGPYGTYGGQFGGQFGGYPWGFNKRAYKLWRKQ